MKYVFNINKFLANNQDKCFSDYNIALIKNFGETFDLSPLLSESSMTFDVTADFKILITRDDCDMVFDSVSEMARTLKIGRAEEQREKEELLELLLDAHYPNIALSGIYKIPKLPESAITRELVKKTEEDLNGNAYAIDKVYSDEKAKTTVIIFKDGLKKVMKCAKGEPYCVDTAVAYAIAEKIYGSNSAFSKAVERALPKKEKVFSYELWKNNNKVDCELAKSLDGKTIKEISKAHKTEFYPKEKALIVDEEFEINEKSDLK
jgi:hypothetical protein